jgi:hypothetical protein
MQQVVTHAVGERVEVRGEGFGGLGRGLCRERRDHGVEEVDIVAAAALEELLPGSGALVVMVVLGREGLD